MSLGGKHFGNFPTRVAPNDIFTGVEVPQKANQIDMKRNGTDRYLLSFSLVFAQHVTPDDATLEACLQNFSSERITTNVQSFVLCRIGG